MGKRILTGTDASPTAGADLYRRAKQLIPGGTQLFSKRPERFLPEQWPAYYSRAEGCHVWDLDGRRFVDMQSCGIGTCLLGAADPDVDAAVKNVIDQGTMSILNPPEEVELAELLCEIHPWAGMVRFTRTGGESDAVAVRIARAHTGRDLVAFCGYHGWHDWYLAANLTADGTLDGHLLRGLAPAGVPRALAGTILPFRYNHIEDLEQVVARRGSELGAIIMEPMRFEEPEDGFLERVREIADHTGAVLIFDEINIGWRHNLGGIHLALGVEPDIVTYAKVISNGYAMGAVLGREEVMQAAQRSFISSSYFTERIGPTAAVATISKMKRVKVWEHAQQAGRRLLKAWRTLGEKHELKVDVGGRPALCRLGFDCGEEGEALRSLYTQEMLDRGFLSTFSFYPTLAHTDEILDQYVGALDQVFGVLREALEQGDVTRRLRGPMAHADFRRLT